MDISTLIIVKFDALKGLSSCAYGWSVVRGRTINTSMPSWHAWEADLHPRPAQPKLRLWLSKYDTIGTIAHRVLSSGFFFFFFKQMGNKLGKLLKIDEVTNTAI